MRIADFKPNPLMSIAIASNFSCNGVTSSYLELNNFDILPMQLYSPTTVITILPDPPSIFVPDNTIGEGTSWLFAVFFPPCSMISFRLWIHSDNTFFFMGSVSPVIADSSDYSSDASRTTPSAGISIPSTKSMISPTITSD